MFALHQRLGGQGLHGLLPLAIAAVFIEIGWRLWGVRKGYNGIEAAATLGVAAGNLAFGVVNAMILATVFGAVQRLAPVHWPLSDWRTWALGFVVVEFAYYWSHRFSHQVRWMWASHAVHHTPTQITFLSAIRLGWTNVLSGAWIVYLPVLLIGFDARLITLLLAIDLHYQFFLHTEAKVSLGPLEWVLNTPAHHRVHHASNPAYLDRNFGGMIILYDRLFGTFACEQADDAPRYGLVHPPASRNPVGLALGEWRRLACDLCSAPNFKSAFRLAFGPPA